jgi:hypothetical protein
LCTSLEIQATSSLSPIIQANSLKLLTIVLTGQLATFESSNLGQPTSVPLCTAEPGVEEVLRAIPRERETHGSATEANYIHVVILHALAGRKVVLTKRRAHAIHLVGSHGSAHTAAANENAPFHVSSRHSASEWDREIGVVVVRVIYLVAKINNLVSFCRQQLGELPLHLESTVVSSYSYFHSALPCRAIWLFAAATTVSTLKPNFFNSCFKGADAPKVLIPML